MTVLYIDDDEDDIFLFKEALQRVANHASFLSFTNGKEALKFLNDSILLPDYVFLDINMPYMTGKEVLYNIRQDDRLRELPVIMYTTSKNEQEVTDFLVAGASAFIQKGADMRAIERDISGIIGKARF